MLNHYRQFSKKKFSPRIMRVGQFVVPSVVAEIARRDLIREPRKREAPLYDSLTAQVSRISSSVIGIGFFWGEIERADEPLRVESRGPGGRLEVGGSNGQREGRGEEQSREEEEKGDIFRHLFSLFCCGRSGEGKRGRNLYG